MGNLRIVKQDDIIPVLGHDAGALSDNMFAGDNPHLVTGK